MILGHAKTANLGMRNNTVFFIFNINSFNNSAFIIISIIGTDFSFIISTFIYIVFITTVNYLYHLLSLGQLIQYLQPLR